MTQVGETKTAVSGGTGIVTQLTYTPSGWTTTAVLGTGGAAQPAPSESSFKTTPDVAKAKMDVYQAYGGGAAGTAQAQQVNAQNQQQKVADALAWQRSQEQRGVTRAPSEDITRVSIQQAAIEADRRWLAASLGIPSASVTDEMIAAAGRGKYSYQRRVSGEFEQAKGGTEANITYLPSEKTGENVWFTIPKGYGAPQYEVGGMSMVQLPQAPKGYKETAAETFAKFQKYGVEAPKYYITRDMEKAGFSTRWATQLIPPTFSAEHLKALKYGTVMLPEGTTITEIRPPKPQPFQIKYDVEDFLSDEETRIKDYEFKYGVIPSSLAAAREEPWAAHAEKVMKTTPEFLGTPTPAMLRLLGEEVLIKAPLSAVFYGGLTAYAARQSIQAYQAKDIEAAKFFLREIVHPTKARIPFTEMEMPFIGGTLVEGIRMPAEFAMWGGASRALSAIKISVPVIGGGTYTIPKAVIGIGGVSGLGGILTGEETFRATGDPIKSIQYAAGSAMSAAVFMAAADIAITGMGKAGIKTFSTSKIVEGKELTEWGKQNPVEYRKTVAKRISENIDNIEKGLLSPAEKEQLFWRQTKVTRGKVAPELLSIKPYRTALRYYGELPNLMKLEWRPQIGFDVSIRGGKPISIGLGGEHLLGTEASLSEFGRVAKRNIVRNIDTAISKIPERIPVASDVYEWGSTKFWKYGGKAYGVAEPKITALNQLIKQMQYRAGAGSTWETWVREETTSRHKIGLERSLAKRRAQIEELPYKGAISDIPRMFRVDIREQPSMWEQWQAEAKRFRSEEAARNRYQARQKAISNMPYKGALAEIGKMFPSSFKTMAEPSMLERWNQEGRMYKAGEIAKRAFEASQHKLSKLPYGGATREIPKTSDLLAADLREMMRKRKYGKARDVLSSEKALAKENIAEALKNMESPEKIADMMNRLGIKARRTITTPQKFYYTTTTTPLEEFSYEPQIIPHQAQTQLTSAMQRSTLQYSLPSTQRMIQRETTQTRIGEMPRIRVGELERMKQGEVQRARLGEVTKTRLGEIQSLKLGEVQKLKLGEVTKLRMGEITRLRMGEITRLRMGQITKLRITEIPKPPALTLNLDTSFGKRLPRTMKLPKISDYRLRMPSVYAKAFKITAPKALKRESFGLFVRPMLTGTRKRRKK